jgi:hypothetical protein
MRKNMLFLPFLVFVIPVSVSAQDSEPDTVVITAGSDPVIAAVRADALDHKNKVVPQTCVIQSENKKDRRQTTQQMKTEGPDAFKWQITDLQINGVPASDRDLKKAKEKRKKNQKKMDEENNEGYEQFAELIADKDRIERLPEMDGMRRYRINRLPDRLAKDMPGAFAEQLKPILWIADAGGEPYVRRLEVSMGEFRMYLVAKVKHADFDIYFERREDRYVKERTMRYDMQYSLFGGSRFEKGEAACDAGGAVVLRSDPDK